MDGFIDGYQNSDGFHQKVTGYGPARVTGDHRFLLLMPVQKCMACFLLDFTVQPNITLLVGLY